MHVNVLENTKNMYSSESSPIMRSRRDVSGAREGRGGEGSSCRTSDIPLHSDHGAVRKMAEIGRRAAPAPYNNFSIEIVRNAKKDRIDSAAYTRAFWISFIPFVTNVPLNYAESFIV